MDVMTPMMLNLSKCAIASAVIYLVIQLLGIPLVPDSSTSSAYMSLFISGICGIAIGDTFYFSALA